MEWRSMGRRMAGWEAPLPSAPPGTPRHSNTLLHTLESLFLGPAHDPSTSPILPHCPHLCSCPVLQCPQVHLSYTQEEDDHQTLQRSIFTLISSSPPCPSDHSTYCPTLCLILPCPVSARSETSASCGL